MSQDSGPHGVKVHRTDPYKPNGSGIIATAKIGLTTSIGTLHISGILLLGATRNGEGEVVIPATVLLPDNIWTDDATRKRIEAAVVAAWNLRELDQDSDQNQADPVVVPPLSPQRSTGNTQRPTQSKQVGQPGKVYRNTYPTPRQEAGH